MKITALGILLASCLTPISLAQDSPKLTQAGQAKVQNFMPDALPSEYKPVRDLDRDSLSEANIDCAFMRTYQVSREHRGSDVVRPTSYRTCIPTRRFELKSAVELQPEPSSQ
jgi:hypothetical protein